MRFLIAATITTLAACGTTTVNAQIESEIEVLKSLANSTGGWENVSSGAWKIDTASSACFGFGWNGIKCEKINDQDRVVEIAFPFRKNINGTIANVEMNKLPYLRKLYITETDLSGSIPNFSTHPTLKTIEIWGNPKLLGPITTQNIPPQLESISIRGSINVAPWNQGLLPLFDAVNATTLKYVAFQYAQVTGTLPSFQRFANLEEVNMGGNKITGAVPQFGPSLRTLTLSDNQLSSFDAASIPATVQRLDVSNNKIVSPFPDLSKLADPIDIDLGNNGFYGNVSINRIPAPVKGQNTTEFVDYTYRLFFNGNSLTGAVPAFTTSWLQTRAAPGVTHKLRWSADCNLFQTGLPSSSIPPYKILDPSCYDNKDQQCTQYCAAKLPGSTSAGSVPSSSSSSSSSSSASSSASSSSSSSTGVAKPGSSTGPKSAASSSASVSMFTGVIAAVFAALAARF